MYEREKLRSAISLTARSNIGSRVLPFASQPNTLMQARAGYASFRVQGRVDASNTPGETRHARSHWWPFFNRATRIASTCFFAREPNARKLKHGTMGWKIVGTRDLYYYSRDMVGLTLRQKLCGKRTLKPSSPLLFVGSRARKRP